MKRKISALLLLLLALMTAFHAVSSADEPGFFGQMARDEFADERLSILDQVAEKVSASATADNGIAFEVGQAFYTGDLVFVAYKIGASTDLIRLHEGAPDASLQWDNVVEDWVEGDIKAYSPDVKKEHDWLDGKGQRWLESPLCTIQDGVTLEDGTFVAFTGGTEIRQEDGSVLGWRECTVPAEKSAGTLTLTVAADSVISTRFQDYSTYRLKNSEKIPVTVTFTLNQVDDPLAIKVLSPDRDSDING